MKAVLTPPAPAPAARLSDERGPGRERAEKAGERGPPSCSFRVALLSDTKETTTKEASCVEVKI